MVDVAVGAVPEAADAVTRTVDQLRDSESRSQELKALQHRVNNLRDSNTREAQIETFRKNITAEIEKAEARGGEIRKQMTDQVVAQARKARDQFEPVYRERVEPTVKKRVEPVYRERVEPVYKERVEPTVKKALRPRLALSPGRQERGVPEKPARTILASSSSTSPPSKTGPSGPVFICAARPCRDRREACRRPCRPSAGRGRYHRRACRGPSCRRVCRSRVPPASGPSPCRP